MSFTDFQIVFLGTAAGKPSNTRNVSSLALRMDGNVWLVDAGEATQHRLIDRRNKLIRLGKISKIFITHLHGDHIYGLPGLLSSIDHGQDSSQGCIEVYGPKGLREYLATAFRVSSAELARPCVVHELLFAGECPSPSDLMAGQCGASIPQREDGTWDVVVAEVEGIEVRAAPIAHRVPCFGYVFQELDGYASLDMASIRPRLMAHAATLRAQGVENPLTLLKLLKGDDATGIELPDGTWIEPVARDKPGRKVVVLGDTSSPYGPLESIAQNPTLLIHEATNVYIDASIEPTLVTKGETRESCQERMISRGHSTPELAGKFAKALGAENLVLNHLSTRLLPDDEHVMDVVRAEATRAWASGKCAFVARDFASIRLEKNKATEGFVAVYDESAAL